MPTGSKYAAGDQAWGLCQKCALRFLLRDLVFDGYYPGLRVCVDCYDSRQPQEFLVDVTDPTALWKPSPEWGPENPQLTAVIFANDIFLSWTECIPRGGSRVAAYLLYRSTSLDGVNYTASVQIANLPVVYYTDLADLVENGDPKFDNEGIELEFLTYQDVITPGPNYVRYQVFAQMASKRLANSNVLTLPVTSAGAVGSIASSANLVGAVLAAFLPPVGNSTESIQSSADLVSVAFTSIDPFFADVVLLLHMDGSNGATAFPDNSLVNNTMTAHGTTAVSTTSPEFGTGSMLMTTNTDNLTTPCAASTALDISTGDFTVEFWYWPESISSVNTQIFEIGSGAGYLDGGFMLYQTPGGGGLSDQLFFQTVMTDGIVSGATVGGALTALAWNACALCRQGGFFYLFVNGVGGHIGGASDTNPIRWPGGTLKIGAGFWNTNIPGTKWDELRITKGFARYTSNYTPVGPFPNS